MQFEKRTKKRLGLAGYPIKHSLSPAMHNAVYREFNLNWHYELFPCQTTHQFKQLIAGTTCKNSDFIGLNITMPFKHDAFNAAAMYGDATCEIVQAANVLTVADTQLNAVEKPKQLIGSNTDGLGLAHSLLNDGNASIKGSNVIICGTGAVAATAFVELCHLGANNICVLSRTDKSAKAFLDKMPLSLRENCLPLSYDDKNQVAEAIRQANIIIDATPTGMTANAAAVIPTNLISPGQVVLDVVYGHGDSTLLREARKLGATAIDGLGMLIEQAALSIQTWFAVCGITETVPRAILKDAALRALSSR
ncbi:MAG: shikimate dehydrogenase [Coriobacteriales bacterium]|jgi:shikimate dehydrogenase|nr:shikimate dehydrogenase [Coriobacteriales bacterium]